MTHQQIEQIDRAIDGFSRQDKIELIERLARSLGEEQIPPAPVVPADALAKIADHKPIWEVADELRESIPAEEWEQLPTDGAGQLDHYLYGHSKRPG